MAADWDKRFIELARFIAQWSKDPSTKVGAIIVRPDINAVISTGFNGFPKGHCDDPSLYADRVYKYAHVIHAEENALRFLGYRARGCYAYTSFPACTRCLKLLSDGGVVRVIQPRLSTEGHDQKWIDEWTHRLEESRTLAASLGIEVMYKDGL